MSECTNELASRLPAPTRRDVQPTPFERLARRVVHAVLARLEDGQIRLHEPDGTTVWGRPNERFPVPVDVEVLAPSFYPAIAFHGTIGSGEAWGAGEWRCSDLTTLIRMILHNGAMRTSLETGTARIVRPLRRILHHLRRNHRVGSRRNIAAHYDLGNDFFDQFLDPTMTYSAGVFESSTDTMEEASITKYERLCKAVDLRQGDHLLEIGGGWGGFALHAARTRGCRVTTTTLSRAQHAWAREKVAAAGLGDRIDVRLEDYRDLRGRYDKLVSIEMIEAVGHQYFPTFFRVCSERLAPHGRMALQCIVIRDDAYEEAARNVDFIKRYIFPGGCLPSLSVIARHVSEVTDLAITAGEDITAHYAETLRRWRARLYDNARAIGDRGYPEGLLRLWEFYLCYCEAGFEQRHIGTVQLAFEKPAAADV